MNFFKTPNTSLFLFVTADKYADSVAQGEMSSRYEMYYCTAEEAKAYAKANQCKAIRQGF